MRRRMLFVIAATGDGDTVQIASGCFGPTTLKVDPGDTVTFVNLDPYVHNVSAVGWGHLDDLNRGDSFQATFADAGVYPFACQYHPAMVGAIVVGDGKALAGGTPVVSEDTSTADTSTKVAAALATESSSTGATTGWLAGGAIGVAAGLAIGLIARRARQRDS